MFHVVTMLIGLRSDGVPDSHLQAVSVDADQGVFLRYRLFADEDVLHLHISTGPFSATTTSTDALVRFETNIASDGAWWTDNNGLELQQRQRWARPFASGVNYSAEAGNEPVSINMYPVTATAVLADTDASKPALALITANSHACTSMVDGEIELTLNRNVIRSGARFTGNRQVTQHTVLVVGRSSAATTTAARGAAAALSNPTLMFASAGVDANAPSGVPPFAPMSVAFPPEVAIVSLQLLPAGFNLSSLFRTVDQDRQPPLQHGGGDAGTMLLRVRHIHQLGVDDRTVTGPVTVNLASALAPRWIVASAVEWTIDGSEAVAAAAAKRMHWPEAQDGVAVSPSPLSAESEDPPGTVTLQPMELKTFMLMLA